MENKTNKKKLNVSGYRGIWGEDLNEEITYEYALAFAKMVGSEGGKKIIVGRDARPTGALMLAVVQAALRKEGIEFIYAGIIPTPSILLLVKKLSCDSGIMITASHNPAEYNGIKFVNKNGLFSTQEEINIIEENRSNLGVEGNYVPGVEMDLSDFDNKKFREIHINEILKNIDVELIKSKKFKVALDPINSTGSIITKELLEALGCETFIINGAQDGNFTHKPEPRPENLKDIGRAVLDSKSDIGFAQDPDADRLVIVDEKGVVISEEYTLALAIKSVLPGKTGSVVITLATSSTTEEVASSLGAKIYRTKIGEPNVVEKLIESGAVIGGEGNGGVIYPKINTARDTLVGIGLILELLARENKKISEIVDDLPKYYLRKEQIPFSGNLENIYKNIKLEFPDAQFDETEGLRLSWPDLSWLLIRPSNTEPIIRIFGEAKSEDRLNVILHKAMSLV